MKKTILILAVGCLAAILATPARAAGGPWKVSLWQSGVQAEQVQVGTEFLIRGEGFHSTVLPVKVCLFDRQCQLAEPDRAGDFLVSRSITSPGTYEIWVLQASNPNITGWRVRAKTTVTVSN